MSPDEVIGKLKLLGVDMTRRTLLNYEKAALIEKPSRGGGGAGGRWTDYPEGTELETYAAWALIHGQYGSNGEKLVFGGRLPNISPNAVAFIRNDIIWETFRIGQSINEYSSELQIFYRYIEKRTYQMKKVSVEQGCYYEVESYGIGYDTGGEDLLQWLKSKYIEMFLFADKELKTPK